MKAAFRRYFFIAATIHIILAGFNKCIAQVVITAPGANISACSYPTGYVTLPNIIIDEVNNANKAAFSSGASTTLLLSAPANFEFEPGTGSVSYTAARDISNAGINITTNVITLTLSVGGISKIDKLTINGIRIRAISSGSGNIIRSGGTALINGDLVGSIHGLVSSGGISGVKSIGPNPSDYLSITAAYADLISKGIIGNTLFELKANYTSSAETFPITFNGSGCINPSATLTIRPASDAVNLSIVSNNATGTINLNGATNITFDGRPGGTGNTSQLTLANTSASAYVLQLVNGACYNTIRYCSINGVTASTKGLVYFAGSSSSSGNSNNLIDHCDIGAGATTPYNCISSNGSLQKNNRLNVISNNLIHDFFSAATDCNGVLLTANTDSWTITGNSFYETSSRNFTSTSAAWAAIQLNNRVNGTNISISNNFIGGQGPTCSGGYLSINGKGKLQAIEINGANGVASEIQGNSLTNIQFTTSNTAYLSLILHNNGSLNIGTTAPNVFGSQSSNGAISCIINGGTITAPATISLIALGMSNNTTGTLNFSNNSVGGISVAGSGYARVRLIELKGTNYTYQVMANTLGGINPGNIQNATNGSLFGVFAQCSGNSHRIENNIIRNFSTTSLISTEAATGGIQIINNPNTASGSEYTIAENNVYGLRSNSTKPGSAGCLGISLSVTSPSNQLITRNTVHSLVGNTAGFNGEIYGINVSVPGGSNSVSKNFIHSLSAANGNSCTITGIRHAGGVATYANNIVRLGIDDAGNNLAANHLFIGMGEVSGNSNFLFNTVFIAGSNTSGNQVSVAFRSQGSGTRKLLNNIFFNARSNTAANNYAMSVLNISSFNSNNNNLFTAGINGKTGQANNVPYASLANWRTATSQDLLSVSGNAQFANAGGVASAGNFAITVGSVCDNSGTSSPPAGLITDDYNGITRNTTTPDIGAFELSLQHGKWTGLISSDWNDPANWEDLQIPGPMTNVVIATGNNNIYGDFMPLVQPGVTAYAKDLSLQLSTSSLTLEGRLVLSGAVSNNGTINAENGTLELRGSTPQAISGCYFSKHTIYRLVISNDATISGIENDTLKITGLLEFGNVNGKTLNTGNKVTLISSSSGTASIADMTLGGTCSGNAINGKITVERFIPGHPKAWQFLSAPTIGSSIKNAWQEGSAAALANPTPGYGTIMTSHLPDALSLGFDFYTPSSSSVQTYNEQNDSWMGISSLSLPVGSQQGYLIFVRGDRSVTAFNQPATPTILRSSGYVYQPDNPPPVSFVAAGKKQAVANPYPSAIDFGAVIRTGGVADLFYVWDPLLSGGSGYGGWQTITSNAPASGYTVTPGGGSYIDGKTTIESGQAFLVSSPLTPGSVSFSESCKTSGSRVVFKPGDRLEEIKIDLFNLSLKETKLLDGVRMQFHESYLNNPSIWDAERIMDSRETIAIKKGNRYYAVEKVKETVLNKDIYLANLKKGSYRLNFNMNLSEREGITAVVHDRYLGQETTLPWGQNINLDLMVTEDAASSAGDRFSLEFRKAGSTSPVNDLASPTAEIKSPATADIAPISVYPNPVVSHKIKIRLTGKPPGNYTLQFRNTQGLAFQTTFSLSHGVDQMAVNLPQGMSGYYQLTIIGPSGLNETIPILVH